MTNLFYDSKLSKLVSLLVLFLSIIPSVSIGQYQLKLGIRYGLPVQTNSYGGKPIGIQETPLRKRYDNSLGISFEIPIKKNAVNLQYNRLNLLHSFVSKTGSNSLRIKYAYTAVEASFMKYLKFSNCKTSFVLESGLSYLYFNDPQPKHLIFTGIEFNDSEGVRGSATFNQIPELLDRTLGLKLGLSTDISLFRDYVFINIGLDYYFWRNRFYIDSSLLLKDGDQSQIISYQVRNPAVVPQVKFKFRI